MQSLVHKALLCLLLSIVGVGCARTTVLGEARTIGVLPRPERVLVHDFVAAPEDVTLNSGMAVQVIRALERADLTEQEIEIGRKVSRIVSEQLVEEINALGLPAERSEGAEPVDGTNLLVHGHFVSIDEGNRQRRIVIGLGAGASHVRTYVQVYETIPSGRRLVDEFELNAKSGRKPGLAETMGAGAAAGNVAVAAAVGAAGSVASETLGADVDADARRTARKIAEVLEDFFVQQGWIEAD